MGIGKQKQKQEQQWLCKDEIWQNNEKTRQAGIKTYRHNI